MDESAGVVAQLPDAPAIYDAGLSTLTVGQSASEAPLPGLLDPGIVRSELSRLRGPGTGVPRQAPPSRDRRRSAFDGHRSA